MIDRRSCLRKTLDSVAWGRRWTLLQMALRFAVWQKPLGDRVLTVRFAILPA